MTASIDPTTWVYVMIQNPGSQEQIVGQQDAESGILFLPAFKDKNAALQGIAHLAKEKGQKYEIQAILFEDLLKHAAEGRFLVFILDDEGRITAKYEPGGQPI